MLYYFVKWNIKLIFLDINSINMKYCKYCKMEYKLYELHTITNKHFIKKITTKKVRFADTNKILTYELSDKERQDKIDNYNLIKKWLDIIREEMNVKVERGRGIFKFYINQVLYLIDLILISKNNISIKFNNAVC